MLFFFGERDPQPGRQGIRPDLALGHSLTGKHHSVSGSTFEDSIPSRDPSGFMENDGLNRMVGSKPWKVAMAPLDGRFALRGS